ncbi:hypothetical protein [Mariniphaga sp.]|uniref:hypothetical protein n=1 Tax=Mariniphaga sp. TaxID=1954475 RepID=UPI00356AF059
MTDVELKKRLIGKITRMKNKYLFQEIYRLVEEEETDTGVYHFTDEETNSINEAREQYRKGQYLNSDEADKEIDTWLGE